MKYPQSCVASSKDWCPDFVKDGHGNFVLGTKGQVGPCRFEDPMFLFCVSLIRLTLLTKLLNSNSFAMSFDTANDIIYMTLVHLFLFLDIKIHITIMLFVYKHFGNDFIG